MFEWRKSGVGKMGIVIVEGRGRGGERWICLLFVGEGDGMSEGLRRGVDDGEGNSQIPKMRRTVYGLAN